MADRLQAYADWLVANQNKRGTPEFDTVANAYKQLRQQPQQQSVAAPKPGVMESLGRGIADRATSIAAGITELPDTVAEAVTGFKDPRLLVPGDANQFMGVDWRNIGDTKFVENTPEVKKLDNPFGFSGDEFENAGKYLRGVQKDIDYQRITPWNEVKSNPTPQNVLAFMGEAAVTSLPDMAAALLATPAYFASYISPIAEERAKNDGRDQVTPEDLSIAATASLAIAGAERFGAKGIFGGQTGNMVTRPIKAGVKESGTEAIQETTQYGAETAGTQAGFNPAQAADQALAGAVGGFGAGTGLRATTDAVTAIAGQDINARAVAEDLIAKGDVLNPKLIGNDPQAATELATRLQTIAQANDLNLKDVNKQSTSGAREAVDKAHIQISEEIKQLARDLRTQLGITDTDELAVVLDKVLAIAGQRQARNKAKSTVGVQEMQAIDRLAGNTQEGQRMLSLMRQMNELTTLHNSGYVGGVSKITDQLSPIPSNVGYSDRSLIETPTRILGTLYGASVNPIIPAIQGAAVIGGRGIDAITGRRSRVATYIKDNLGNSDGIQISDDAESVREKRRIETEGIKRANQQQRARAKEIHKSQYEKNGDLPFLTLDAMLKERGLSPKRAVELLEAMAAADPIIAADARAMIKAIQEGDRAPNMTAVGAAMTTALDQQSTPVTRDKTPVPGAVQAAAASAAAPRDVSAGYVRGIQDNQDANTALIEAVDADPTISDADKAVLIDALADLRSNLGSNPADKAMDIAAKAESQVSDPALVEAYVMPYVNRVIGQQAANTEPTIDMMVPKIGEGLSVFPKTKALYKKIDGIDVKEGNYQAGSEDVTGNTYGGARVSIGENGRGRLEVDPEQSAAPNKQDGIRWHSNLVRPNLYEWIDNPQNLPQSFIVTVDHNKEGHQFALQYEADVPTELYREPLKADGTKPDEPTMRPRGFGELEYGRQIGTIKVKSSGRIAPIYDTIRIVSKQQPVLNMMSTIDFMDNPPAIEGTGKKGIITVEDVGRFLERESIAAGSKAPRTVRGGKETNTIDYTDELKERLFQDILAEAKEFYKNNPGAAYWYTFGSPEALDMMASVIPELKEDGTNHPDKGLPLQLLFWTLISPLSGGQDPVANAKLAVDVLRYYIQNGRIPLSKYKGGLFINDANVEAKEALGEELAWTARGSTTKNALAAIQNGIDTFGSLEAFMEWMTSAHPAAEVTQMYMDLGFGSEESSKNIAKYADADGMVYGSQVLGPKFGPFLLNNSGNESKVTKDEWFTRSWNRLVGRMFTANGKEMLSQPSSPEERMVQDEVISRVAAELGLEPAQLQALWWAYEQQLYTRLGVKSPTRDYVDAAREVIKRVAGEAEALNAERETRARLGEQVAQRTQGSQGSSADGQPTIDYQRRIGDGVASSPADPGEIRDQLAVTEQLFAEGKPIPIGLPGSPFENGIQDLRVVEKIAKALGYAFEIYTNPTRMNKDVKERFNSKGMPKGFVGGFLLSESADPTSNVLDRITGERVRGKIGVLGVYKNPKGTKKLSLADVIWASLHELGHGIERSLFSTTNVSAPAPTTFHNQDGALRFASDKKGKPKVYTETFRDFLMQIMQASSGKPGKQQSDRTDINISKEDAQQVINEMIDMQRTGVLSIAGEGDAVARADYKTVARMVKRIREANMPDSAKALEEEMLRRRLLNAEASYYQTIPELAADMIGMYMADPKGFKKRAPAAAAITRQLLNQINSPTSGLVKFYSMPLASVVAIIMANLLAGEREEEEERGLLNLGRGALTA